MARRVGFSMCLWVGQSLRLSRPALVSIDAQPALDSGEQVFRALNLRNVRLGAAVFQFAVRRKGEVRHPIRHAVEDVRGVHDGRPARLALLLEKREQIETT